MKTTLVSDSQQKPVEITPEYPALLRDKKNGNIWLAFSDSTHALVAYGDLSSPVALRLLTDQPGPWPSYYERITEPVTIRFEP